MNRAPDGSVENSDYKKPIALMEQAYYGELVMHDASILTRIESLREEIKLIQNQERFYRAVKRYSFEENAAHIRREIRLLEMQAELGKLQRR
jgi:protein-arginine kinase activator protein McsA